MIRSSICAMSFLMLLLTGCGGGSFSFANDEPEGGDTGSGDTAAQDSGVDTEDTAAVGQLWVGPDVSPFVAYVDGDSFRIEQISGQFGVPLTMQFSGLDGSTGAGAVVRAVIGAGSSQDAVGGLLLNDLGDGVWTTSTFFPLRQQTGGEVAALEGLSVVFTAAMTDGLGTTVETRLELVAVSP